MAMNGLSGRSGEEERAAQLVPSLLSLATFSYFLMHEHGLGICILNVRGFFPSGRKMLLPCLVPLFFYFRSLVSGLFV